MSLIERHATQEVSLQRRIRDEDGELVLNDYGEPTFEDAESIMAVYEPASGRIRSATGDEVDGQGRLQTATELRLGDKVEGLAVTGVETQIGFTGSVLWYDARL